MTDDQIDIFYELKITNRKADELHSITQRMVAANQAKEPDTLGYNAYLSEDEKRLTFWETHANNDTVRFHSERFANGRYVGQILERT